MVAVGLTVGTKVSGMWRSAFLAHVLLKKQTAGLEKGTLDLREARTAVQRGPSPSFTAH